MMLSRAHHDSPPTIFANLILHSTWQIKIRRKTSLNNQTLVMFVVNGILLEVMEREFGRVHDSVEIDVKDLEIWLLWIAVGVVGFEHGVYAADAGVCDHNIHALTRRVGDCGFEHLQLIAPGSDIASGELSFPAIIRQRCQLKSVNQVDLSIPVLGLCDCGSMLFIEVSNGDIGAA